VRREALGTTTPLGSDPLYRKHIEFYSMPLSSQIDFFKNNDYLCILLLLLCWVFITACKLSLVSASRDCSLVTGTALSLPWLLLWHSTGCRAPRLHGLLPPQHCGIFLDQGSDPCPLHWQANSYPLHHQGHPRIDFSVHFVEV